MIRRVLLHLADLLHREAYRGRQHDVTAPSPELIMSLGPRSAHVQEYEPCEHCRVLVRGAHACCSPESVGAHVLPMKRKKRSR